MGCIWVVPTCMGTQHSSVADPGWEGSSQCLGCSGQRNGELVTANWEGTLGTAREMVAGSRHSLIPSSTSACSSPSPCAQRRVALGFLWVAEGVVWGSPSCPH